MTDFPWPRNPGTLDELFAGVLQAAQGIPPAPPSGIPAPHTPPAIPQSASLTPTTVQTYDRLQAAQGIPPAPPSGIPEPYTPPAALVNRAGKGDMLTLPSGLPAPTDATGYADRIISAESGGDPTARNPRSSAYGAGQFIAGTWLPVIEKYRPDLAQGRSRDEILALRGDVDLNREMIAAYGDENGQALASAGLPVTDSSKYLAHFLGPAGAKTVLSSDIDTPVSSILGADVIRANPHLRGMTAGDLAEWANRKAYGPSGVPGPALAVPPAEQPAPSSARVDPNDVLRGELSTATNFPMPANPSPKPILGSDGKRYSVAEFRTKLQKATAAGDAEAMEYFQRHIANAVNGSMGEAPAPQHASEAEALMPQDGNILDAALAGIPFGDELAGVGGGLASAAMGALGYGAPDESFSKGYNTVTRDFRKRAADYRARHPYVALGTEIGTGLAVPFGAIRTVTRASPLAAAMGAGALYGAGAADPKPRRKLEDLIDPDRQPEDVGLGEALADRAAGAAGGALAGSLGYGAGRLAGTAFRTLFPRIAPKAGMPSFREQIRTLEDAGIPVTSAERIANPDARRAERLLGAYFGQGDEITRRPVTLNRRLMELSNFAPADVNAGELSYSALERARARFNRGYDRVLNGARVPTPDLNPRLNAIDQEFSQLLPFEQKANVRRILDDFGDQIGQSRILTGDAYKRLRSNLGKQAFNAQKSDANRYLAPVYRGMRNALDDAFRRNVHPDRAARLARLDTQYSGFKILEKSADNIDAIGTMANAARRNRGRLNPEFHDLVTAYQDVFLRGGHHTSNTPEGLISSRITDVPIMPFIRATGSKFSSGYNTASNLTGLNFPLPSRPVQGFIAGQQFGGNPQIAEELLKAAGINE